MYSQQHCSYQAKNIQAEKTPLSIIHASIYQTPLNLFLGVTGLLEPVPGYLYLDAVTPADVLFVKKQYFMLHSFLNKLIVLNLQHCCLK